MGTIPQSDTQSPLCTTALQTNQPKASQETERPDKEAEQRVLALDLEVTRNEAWPRNKAKVPAGVHHPQSDLHPNISSKVTVPDVHHA